MPEESVKFFISYSHGDEKLREQLDKHLAPLKKASKHGMAARFKREMSEQTKLMRT